MILFLNVYITDKSQGLKYRRGCLGAANNRLEIFKYSLASFAVIPWSRVVIYYDLCEAYRPQRDEVDRFIRENFQNPEIHHYQNERQAQWQEAVNALYQTDDDLVWFCCNDDHIFIDYELDLLQRMEQACLEKTKTEPFVSCVPTHWPEYLAGANYAAETTADYYALYSQVTNSMQLINRGLLRYWWFEHDYGDAWMPRTDTGTLLHANDGSPAKRVSIIGPERMYVLVPFRELVRHYDGYSHVGVDINACPPLTIPPGFFERNIRIAYGADSAPPGTVLVNPLKLKHKTVDPQGVDLRCVVEDLPLFWRSRITAIEKNEALDPNVLLCARNDAVYDLATQCSLISAERLQTAFRFAPEQDSEAELAHLTAALGQFRLGQYYQQLAEGRSAEKISAAQRYAAWLKDNESAPTSAQPEPEGKPGFIRTTNGQALEKQLSPQEFSPRKYTPFSFLDHFSEGKLVAGKPDQTAVWDVTLEGQGARALLLHPPAKLVFELDHGRAGHLCCAVAMHPDVAAKEGIGETIFTVQIDGRTAASALIDHASLKAGNAWREYRLFIPEQPEGKHVVSFETNTRTSNRSFCWALWREPIFWAARAD